MSFSSSSAVGTQNIETVTTFFSLYLKDKAKFYSLWVDEDPEVITPFDVSTVEIVSSVVHRGWDAVKAFWDPIHDEMEGKFDWTIDDIIVGENPNKLVVRSRSDIDVQAGPTWGNKHVVYRGRYVQIFHFIDGRVKSFEEYYDTVKIAHAYR